MVGGWPGFKAHRWAVADGLVGAAGVNGSPVREPETRAPRRSRLLSHHHAPSRLALSWPAAPGASAKWAEGNTTCSVVLRLWGCLPAKGRQKHTPEPSEPSWLYRLLQRGRTRTSRNCGAPQREGARKGWKGLRLASGAPGEDGSRERSFALGWMPSQSRGDSVIGYRHHFSLEGKWDELKLKL